MNNLCIVGELKTDFFYSHSNRGKHYYQSIICCVRDSGTVDELPIIASESIAKFRQGDMVCVRGSFRSRNLFSDGKKKLNLYVYAKSIERVEEDNQNIIDLSGTICKIGVPRQTPKGKTITDICLAVSGRNRSYYIPCVLWGRNAYFAENFKIGDNIILSGRVQSREYEKLDKLMTAYEVSANYVDLAQRSY